MTKNKKAIGVGIAAFVTGLNKLSNILYSGSDFLNPYIEKVDKIESNNRIEMDDDGYYSVIKGDDTPFKVMQITDLHIGGGYLSRHEDLKALSMVKSAINRVKPDIVVITGDLACSKAHLSFSRNNLNSFRIVTTMLENMGVPYAITFGNHDADKKTMFERRGLTDYLVSRKRSLFAITKETKVITGYSNYLVKLRNSDGKINSVLYMLDSNEYTHRHAIKTYDYIHEDQVTWYKESVDRLNKENGKLVPSHMFFHIPIIEYKDAWDDLSNKKSHTKYFYGTMDEKISPSKIHSKIFDAVLAKKSTKAIFCGHDHLNDFSVEYKGVRLTYGQSADCILYSKNLMEHKGVTVLKIDKDGQFSITPKKCK